MKTLSSSYKTQSAIPVLWERFQTQKVTQAKWDSYLHFHNQPPASNPEVTLSLGVTSATAWTLFILFMNSKAASPPPLLTVTFYCLSTLGFQRWPSMVVGFGWLPSLWIWRHSEQRHELAVGAPFGSSAGNIWQRDKRGHWEAIKFKQFLQTCLANWETLTLLLGADVWTSVHSSY